MLAIQPGGSDSTVFGTPVRPPNLPSPPIFRSQVDLGFFHETVGDKDPSPDLTKLSALVVPETRVWKLIGDMSLESAGIAIAFGPT